MSMKRILMTAAAVLAIGTRHGGKPSPRAAAGNDPYGYYSQYDQQRLLRPRRPLPPHPAPRFRRDRLPRPRLMVLHRRPAAPIIEQGRYEADCHRGNAAAGTIFGALAGGLIGGAASHGNGGAVVGGAILGGLLGNTVSRDIDCDDQPYAFRVYADGLNGDLGQRYEWRNGRAYGYFTPMREFRRGGVVCREFTETSYRSDGRSFTRTGTACRQDRRQLAFRLIVDRDVQNLLQGDEYVEEKHHDDCRRTLMLGISGTAPSPTNAAAATIPAAPFWARSAAACSAASPAMATVWASSAAPPGRPGRQCHQPRHGLRRPSLCRAFLSATVSAVRWAAAMIGIAARITAMSSPTANIIADRASAATSPRWSIATAGEFDRDGTACRRRDGEWEFV